MKKAIWMLYGQLTLTYLPAAFVGYAAYGEHSCDLDESKFCDPPCPHNATLTPTPPSLWSCSCFALPLRDKESLRR